MIYQNNHFVKNRKKQRLIAVILFSAAMMIAQLIGAKIVGSIAIEMDSWHMLVHVVSYAIAFAAIEYAQIHARSDRYTFGTGKVEVLGGFTSAVGLGLVALIMASECIDLLFSPSAIDFNEAIVIGIIGLIVNIISACILHPEDDRDDQNFHAAFIHALTDIFTSALAIIGLFIEKSIGITQIDPAIGLIGCLFIAKWAYDLINSTSDILLDRNISKSMHIEVKRAIETVGSAKVAQAHFWKLGEKEIAGNLFLITSAPENIDRYKKTLRDRFPNLKHICIEILPSTRQLLSFNPEDCPVNREDCSVRSKCQLLNECHFVPN